MLTRYEFHMALLLALSAMGTPDPEAPRMSGFDHVCLDFWPGDSLRIVGTNGNRLAVVFAKVPGLPHSGKFLMPHKSAYDALRALTPDHTLGAAEPRVQLAFFGPGQMIITSGDAAQVVPGPTAESGIRFPEYQIMLHDLPHTDPTKGAVLSAEGLRWMLEQTEALRSTTVTASLRGYSVSTFRPKLHEGFQAIHEVVLAVQPTKVTT